MLYEIDDLQAQLQKALLDANRFQAEKEDFQLDAERHRDKNDKLQVRALSATTDNVYIAKTLSIELRAIHVYCPAFRKIKSLLLLYS